MPDSYHFPIGQTLRSDIAALVKTKLRNLESPIKESELTFDIEEFKKVTRFQVTHYIENRMTRRHERYKDAKKKTQAIFLASFFHKSHDLPNLDESDPNYNDKLALRKFFISEDNTEKMKLRRCEELIDHIYNVKTLEQAKQLIININKILPSEKPKDRLTKAMHEIISLGTIQIKEFETLLNQEKADIQARAETLAYQLLSIQANELTNQILHELLDNTQYSEILLALSTASATYFKLKNAYKKFGKNPAEQEENYSSSDQKLSETIKEEEAKNAENKQTLSRDFPNYNLVPLIGRLDCEILCMQICAPSYQTTVLEEVSKGLDSYIRSQNEETRRKNVELVVNLVAIGEERVESGTHRQNHYQNV